MSTPQPATGAVVTSHTEAENPLGILRYPDIQRLGPSALWDELVALLRGDRGRALLTSITWKEGPTGRIAPQLAAKLRTKHATIILRMLAESLIDSGLQERIAGLPGRDIGGRGDALQLLDRALHIQSIDPPAFGADRQLQGQLTGAANDGAIARALLRLRDEVCNTKRDVRPQQPERTGAAPTSGRGLQPSCLWSVGRRRRSPQARNDCRGPRDVVARRDARRLEHDRPNPSGPGRRQACGTKPAPLRPTSSRLSARA